MELRKRFTSHPATVGETYGTHFKFAMKVAAELFKSGFACLAHGIYPPVFSETASRTIKDLSIEIEERSSASDTSHVSVADSLVS